jgi:transcriptional regulator with XRE-family HTH domain
MATLTRTGLSSRLVELRERHDPPLTQKEAADLIGVSLRQYGRLERGQADATMHTIRKIAAAYGVEPRVLTEADPIPPAFPTPADLARLEQKLELLLDHFGLSAAGEEAPAPDVGSVRAYEAAPAPVRRRRGAAPRTPGRRPA